MRVLRTQPALFYPTQPLMYHLVKCDISPSVEIVTGTCKPQRQRQRECGKAKDLMGRTKVQHVRFKTSTFQNKNVKSPKFAWSENGGYVSFYWNVTLLSNTTLKFRYGIEKKRRWTPAGTREILHNNINSFFRRLLLWRCLPDCWGPLIIVRYSISNILSHYRSMMARKNAEGRKNKEK